MRVRAMHRLVARTLGTAIAAGIALSPIAAQANTRAGDNAALYADAASQQADDGNKNRKKRGLAWWFDSDMGRLLLGATGVALLIVLWDDGDSDDQRESRGGFQSNGAN
ncbi:hypothetical protein [Altererythrobacter sp.]|uniref:hypothetical protein n=1 Tax=Altererythrobacter sp. TaxID=1872480 RepID=UPI003D0EE196